MNSECQPRRQQANVADRSSPKRQIGFQSSPTVRTSRLATKAAVHTYISCGRTPRMPDRRRRPACYRRYLPCKKGYLCECDELGWKHVGRRHRPEDKSWRRSGLLFAFCRSVGRCWHLRMRMPAPLRSMRPMIEGAVADSFSLQECSSHPLHLKLDQYTRVLEES